MDETKWYFVKPREIWIDDIADKIVVNLKIQDCIRRSRLFSGICLDSGKDWGEIFLEFVQFAKRCEMISFSGEWMMSASKFSKKSSKLFVGLVGKIHYDFWGVRE